MLGGWAGEVETIGYFTPRMYRGVWTPETLAMAHPAYAKRCFRDELDPEETWLELERVIGDLSISVNEMKGGAVKNELADLCDRLEAAERYGDGQLDWL